MLNVRLFNYSKFSHLKLGCKVTKKVEGIKVEGVRFV